MRKGVRMLHIQRSHSQTMTLIRETEKVTRTGIVKECRLLGVCHVRDNATLNRWRKSGAKEPEVIDIRANRAPKRKADA